MGLSQLLNSVELFSSTNAGTGTITLGGLVNTNALTMAEAGAVNGQGYVFRLDAANGDFEIVRCTYNSAGPSITRDTVLVSKIGGVAGTSKIAVTTATACRIVLTAEDAITRQAAMSRGWLVGG